MFFGFVSNKFHTVVFDYLNYHIRGHLNESLLLKTELVLGRKTWESARAPNIKLVQATRPVHKPIKKQEKGKRSYRCTSTDVSVKILTIACHKHVYDEMQCWNLPRLVNSTTPALYIMKSKNFLH